MFWTSQNRYLVGLRIRRLRLLCSHFRFLDHEPSFGIFSYRFNNFTSHANYILQHTSGNLHLKFIFCSVSSDNLQVLIFVYSPVSVRFFLWMSLSYFKTYFCTPPTSLFIFFEEKKIFLTTAKTFYQTEQLP